MGRPQAFDEDEVITKALDIFWTNGFRGTSTRNLIEGTGISNGSFFNSFTDKKKIYLKCLQKYLDLYMIKLEEMLLNNEPFQEKIRKVLHYTVRKDPKDGSYKGCFHFNTIVDNTIDDVEISKLTEEISHKMENTFIKAVDMAKEKNEMPATTKSTALAQYLITVMSGLRVLLKTNPPPSVLSDIIGITLHNLSDR